MDYSKCRYIIKIVIFFLTIPAYLFSDTVFLKDGSKYSGAILNADDFIVNIQINDTTLVQIPHHQIKSIFFTKADVLSLGRQKSVKCKILKREYPYLFYVTPDGLQKISTISYEAYYYNAEDSLEISFLPPTGPEFKNYILFKPEEKKEKLMTKKWSFGLGLNFHWPPAQSWNEKFFNSSSIIGVFGSVRMGYRLSSDISLSLGYEHSQYDIEASKNPNFVEGSSNQFETSFFFVSFDYYPNINISEGMPLFAGIDIGVTKHKGQFLLYSYRGVNFSDKKYNFSFRPRIGLDMNPITNLSTSFELSYFFSKSNSISIPIENFNSFSIDFTGIIIMTNIKYHFNL